MCRMIIFSGTCTRCGQWFQWDELSQALSCLEAKNSGVFGDCRRGVLTEEHSFDQECDFCVDQSVPDEGIELEEGLPESTVHHHHYSSSSSHHPDKKKKKQRQDGRDSERERDRGKSKRQRTS